MKKIISLSLLALLAGTLSACDTGNSIADKIAEVQDKKADSASGDTASDDTAGFTTITKAQYLALLDCFVGKVPGSDAGIAAAKTAVNNIPDATWNSTVAGPAGAAYKGQFDLAIAAGCSVK